MLVSKLCPKGWYEAIVFPSLFAIGEWLLTLGTLAFPWGTTAVALTGFIPFVQVASLLGQYFITFSVSIFCYLLVLGLSERKKLFCVFSVSIFLIHTLIGTVLYLLPQYDERTVKVAMIQGNVLSNEKWDPAAYPMIFDTYISLTDEAAANGAEIVLLPESAIPSRFYKGSSVHTALASIAEKYNATVIAGVTARDDEGQSHNGVIAIYPDGSLSDLYSKRHLVPFGEFVPFADTLGKLFPFVADFDQSGTQLTQGKRAVMIDTPFGNAGSMVCFDSIFPFFARDNAKNGAKMHMVVTNDSWFNDSQGIYTHLRHSQIRAVETGKPILRAANTGISAVLDKRGNIISYSEPLVTDIVYGNICPNQSNTLYTFIGDSVLVVLALMILFIIIQKYIGRKKYGKNQAL